MTIQQVQKLRLVVTFVDIQSFEFFSLVDDVIAGLDDGAVSAVLWKAVGTVFVNVHIFCIKISDVLLQSTAIQTAIFIVSGITERTCRYLESPIYQNVRTLIPAMFVSDM